MKKLAKPQVRLKCKEITLMFITKFPRFNYLTVVRKEINREKCT